MQCYPARQEIGHDETITLTASELNHQNFAQEKQRFSAAYRNGSRIRQIIGLTNSTVELIGMIRHNNTLYAVMSFDEVQTTENIRINLLRNSNSTSKTLRFIIHKYHSNSCLHLDIKPENILILPETAEHVKLFDFASIQPVK